MSDMASLPRLSTTFSVEVNGYGYEWDNIGRFVLPGETLRLAVPGKVEHSGFVASAGELVEDGGTTDWVAPVDPGLYPIIVTVVPAVKHINVFVMVPYDSLKNGFIKGVRIGRYPKDIEQFPNLRKPRGFIEVTPDNMGTPISQRYTLGEFVPRQPDGLPKYMSLREELLVKMELLTDLVQEKGYKFDKFSVISGYRAPAFNRRNRNGRNSAHVYGGAADILVDANHDGSLDDLNHDGESNRKDAVLLAGFDDELEVLHPEIVGGCGWYRRTRNRTPFIHIDVRGMRSRWHQ
jgi:hypothetical protein